jgi:hypothetical protein
MGRYIRRRLSDGTTSIVGDFSHTNDGGMVNDFVLLGAKFKLWASENCGTTDTESLCAIVHKESLSLTDTVKANYEKLQKSCFEKIKASGLQIPIFTTT